VEEFRETFIARFGLERYERNGKRYIVGMRLKDVLNPGGAN
jgi:hypothetical protein